MSQWSLIPFNFDLSLDYTAAGASTIRVFSVEDYLSRVPYATAATAGDAAARDNLGLVETLFREKAPDCIYVYADARRPTDAVFHKGESGFVIYPLTRAASEHWAKRFNDYEDAHGKHPPATICNNYPPFEPHFTFDFLSFHKQNLEEAERALATARALVARYNKSDAAETTRLAGQGFMLGQSPSRVEPGVPLAEVAHVDLPRQPNANRDVLPVDKFRKVHEWAARSTYPYAPLRLLTPSEVLRESDFIKTYNPVTGAPMQAPIGTLREHDEPDEDWQKRSPAGQPVGDREAFRTMRRAFGIYRLLDVGEEVRASDGYRLRDPWLWFAGIINGEMRAGPGLFLELSTTPALRKAQLFLCLAVKVFIRHHVLERRSGKALFQALKDERYQGALMFPSFTEVDVACWEKSWDDSGQKKHDWLAPARAVVGSKVGADWKRKFFRPLVDVPTRTEVGLPSDPNQRHRLQLFEQGLELPVEGGIHAPPVELYEPPAPDPDDQYGFEFES